MQITLIVLILVAIFGFLFYNKYIKNRKDNKKIEDQKDNETENIPDFDQVFFERTQIGEPYQLFLTLATQQDCALIRGLLQAENIPTYIEGEHMNNIYGGITGNMTSVVGIKLYILCKDYDTAYDIVKNFKADSSGITIHEKKN